MISVLVKGYGVIVWHDADHWRAYCRSDAVTAMLSTRVGMALTASAGESHDAVRDQLLRIRGALLLAEQPEQPEQSSETSSD